METKKSNAPIISLSKVTLTDEEVSKMIDFPSVLLVADRRMLALIHALLEKELIKSKQAFYDTIGIYKQNVTTIKSGKKHFTVKQIGIACKTYNVNANWILGIENNVFNPDNQ